MRINNVYELKALIVLGTYTGKRWQYKRILFQSVVAL